MNNLKRKIPKTHNPFRTILIVNPNANIIMNKLEFPE